MKKLIISFTFLIGCMAAKAQQDFICHPHDDRLTPREHPVDIIKMKVEVSFQPEHKRVIGRVAHTFRPLQKKVDSIFFDGPDIMIKTAVLDGKDVKFTTSKDGITVWPSSALTWDKEHTLVFEYNAQPKRGLYFIGWNQPEEKLDQRNPWHIRRQVWTQGQGIDNRHWIPMYDDANDKFITETVVTFDKKYKVLSNGKKVSEKDIGNGTKTWHYAMSKPHAGYLLMLGIGEYEIKQSKTSRGTPLYFYYYPGMEKWVEPTYRYTEKMFDFLEAETGVPYPWESYSQIMVQDFLYGAMENTTATVFGDFMFVDDRAFLDRNYVGVNCHELTHQWFGDYITHRSNAEIWLHESYATYYPKLMQLKMDGLDAYQWAQKSEMDRALDAAKKDSYPVRHSKGGSARHYPKGSIVISMLKDVVGDSAFNRALNHYLTTHAYKNVETNDLYQSLQDVLGIAPSWFFEQWLYRGGEPHYDVKWEEITSGKSESGAGKTIRVTVKQIHKISEGTGLFKMPVEILVYYGNGMSISKKVMLSNETEVIDIENHTTAKVMFVVFDKGNRILKNVTFNRTHEELEAQAQMAPDMIDRYEALLAMKSTSIDKKRTLLQHLVAGKDFWGIRAEATTQLVNDSLSIPILIKALADPNVNVRKAALTMHKIPAELKLHVEALLKDSSYVIIETALEKLCRDFPKDAVKYLDATDGILGMNNALRIKWLEIAGAQPSTAESYWAGLAIFAGPGYEFRTRINAFDALKRTNFFSGKVFASLLEASVSQNGRLAGPAYSALEHFAKQNLYRAQIVELLSGTITPSPAEAKVLKQLGL
ncbi:MAG TPA: M1 family metallopeptidase [Bacteroidia bacterium]|nr:M1 family metallopeptidase [Bacteroidia bacterium]